MLPPRSFLMQKLSAPYDGGVSAAVTPVPTGDKSDVLKSKNPKKSSEKTSNIGWILSLTKEEKLPLAVGITGMTIASGMNLVFPRIMGKAIDVASGKPAPGGLSRKGFVVVVLATFFTGSVGSFLRTYSLGMVAERIAAKLRRRLYKLTLVSLTILPLVGTGAMLFSKFSSRLSKKHHNSVADMTGIAEERLNNIFTVKLFSAEQDELDHFEKINKNILANAKRAKRARGAFMGGLSLSINCSLFSVLYFGGSLVGSGELTIGTLTSFALYSGFMGLGFSGVSSCLSEMKKTRLSSEALFDLLSLPPAADGENTLVNVKGHVRFNNVSFAYPSRPDILVLDNLNMEINPGEVVAIVGKSGAGKTTIASLMSKIIKPTSGTVTLDGVDIATLKASWLRKQIGVVNQEPSLFASTIAENIMYGAEVHNKDQLIAAAKEAHAHEFIMELPNQYDTFVGEKGVELSGGQKQRIAIARALYKQTNILLFDEATSSLDGRSEDMIRRALQSAAENRTVFIIAHRLNTIKHANRIILLEEGVIAETGTFEELNKEGSKFYNLAHNQAPLL
ncbi:Tubulin delta chain [Phytophthora nicotianae]|uniref:Tubulin delta chain n=1 Tax=Phytophthora nicotianae TaxID=4792 RepID=A0A0W8DSP1_PHYNI|nr:Tubulin delta chain [Phytophthora nicotianae]